MSLGLTVRSISESISETMTVLCRRTIDVDSRSGEHLKLFYPRILIID